MTFQASQVCTKLPYAKTNTYTNQFPKGYHQYIASQTDVTADGNCGYRVVAEAMGFGQKAWRNVRKDLLQELQSMPSLYKDLIYGPKRYEEFKHALNFDKTGYAKKEYWMSMPDMGYLISTYYKVIVIYLSNAQCLTLLPLMLPSELHDLELPEIAIGFVKIGNKGHFVQVLYLHLELLFYTIDI